MSQGWRKIVDGSSCVCKREKFLNSIKINILMKSSIVGSDFLQYSGPNRNKDPGPYTCCLVD